MTRDKNASSQRVDKHGAQHVDQHDAPRETRKALQKREQKTLDRLREAQQAQAKAQARFERAQARLQKCTSRLETYRRQFGTRPAAIEALDTPAPASQPAPELTGQAPLPAVSEAHAAAEAAEESNAQRPKPAQSSSTIVFFEEEEEPTSIMIPPEIEQIEEEETIVEASAAETYAHIIAERAAKARVAADISTAQTREARLRAQQAEQALGRVRLDIRYGVLSGEEADIALRAGGTRGDRRPGSPGRCRGRRRAGYAGRHQRRGCRRGGRGHGLCRRRPR